jgi:RNA polymerase sigma factor (sigma-70 family)
MASRPPQPTRHTEPPGPRAEPGVPSGLTDAQLLDRFNGVGAEGAEAAFETLVSRHGPMVLRTCRALLGDAHAAEDAFQATFLVLMRRAGSLRVHGSLSPWLHEVAYRVASCERSAAARRARHERRAAEMTGPDRRRDEPGQAHDDAGPVLHEEVSRLAERYRRPVILCYLQGLTSEQAAQQLGWPVGTVRSRLARARERLRGRLVRRGVVLSASLFGASLAGEGTAGVLPPSLAGSTVRAVMKVAAGAEPPTPVAELVEVGLEAAGPNRAWLPALLAGAALLLVVTVVALVLPARTRPRALAPSETPRAPATPLASTRLGGSLPGVWSLALSPDGATLVSGHNEEIRVWDLTRRRQICRVAVPGRTVRRVDLARDGRFLAAAQYPSGGKPADQDVVTLRDPGDGHVLRTIHGHDQGVNCVAISPDGKTIASNDWDDQVVRLWDASTGQPVGTLAGHTGAVISLAYAPDGLSLASTSADQTVRIWDTTAHSARCTLRGHTKGVETAAFSPDGRRVASGGYDRTVRVWDAVRGEELASLTLPSAVLTVAFSPDGRTVAVACARWGAGSYDPAPSELVIWAPEAPERVKTWPAGQSQVFGLAYTPDGHSLISGGLDGSIRVWDVPATAGHR